MGAPRNQPSLRPRVNSKGQKGAGRESFIWTEVEAVTHSISSTAFRAASGKSLNFVFLLIPPPVPAAAAAAAVGPADVAAVGAKELGGDGGGGGRRAGADGDEEQSKQQGGGQHNTL